MKITVLGGAAAGGNTGSGCSGYLVQTGSTNLVVDLGPGTLHELRRHCDFRSLDAVVITHWHVDHILDLAALRYALAYNPVRPDRKVPLYCFPGGLQLLRRFGETLQVEELDEGFFSDWFDLQEFDPSTVVEAGDLRCRFHPTLHFVPCWAVRISGGDGPDAGYTADTGPGAGLETFFAGVGTLIAEATILEYPAGVERPGHLTAAGAGQLASETGAGTLVLTHTWEELGFGKYLEGARSTFSGEILVAAPGLQVGVGTGIA